MVSAYINTPPATHRDYLIAKGMLLSVGLTTLDPANGVKLEPAKPPNYQYETKGPGIVAGLSFDIAFIIIVTCTRLYLRWAIKRLKWGIDDTLIAIALPMAVAYPALQIACVKYGGAGQHIFDITYEQYYINKWLANIASVDFFVCVGIVKMSITGFNIRLTSLSSLKWQIINWTFFALCTLYTLFAFFLNVFQCSPTGSSFDLLILARKDVAPTCVGVKNMNVILRAINITLDYCLLAVPIIVLWKVQMSWRKKLRLFTLLSVGGLACVGSVMTLVSKFRLSSDTLWNYTGILGWSLVELTLGVLAASLPTLAFLLPRSTSTDESYANSNAHPKNNSSNSSGHNDAKRNSFPTFAPNPNVSPVAFRAPRVESLVHGGHNNFCRKGSVGTSSWLDIDSQADTVRIMERHSPDHDIEMRLQRQPSDTSSVDHYGASLQGEVSHGQLHGTPMYIDTGMHDVERAVSIDAHMYGEDMK